MSVVTNGNSSGTNGPHHHDMGSQESRWRNYQHLLWTQQQIHMQIQQQNHLQNNLGKRGQDGTSGGFSGNSMADTSTAMTSGPLGPTVTPVPNGGQHHNGHATGNSDLNGSNNEGSANEEKTKDLIDPWENLDAHSAFLGPNLWEKRLPYDGEGFKLEYVDLEEFLNENGIPMGTNEVPGLDNSSPNSTNSSGSSSGGPGPPPAATSSSVLSNTCSSESSSPFPPVDPNPAVSLLTTFSNSHHGRGTSASSSSHSLSSAVAAAAAVASSAVAAQQLNHSRGPGDHSSPQRRRSLSPMARGRCRSNSSSLDHELHSVMSPGSSSGDLSMVSIPGHDFDPRTRSFTDDELKPQPMVKKSRKQFVPDEAKDAKYWARRRKNNLAAKRSRDARRVKENQIAMRACYLEKENAAIKEEFERIHKENLHLKEQLSRCHREHR